MLVGEFKFLLHKQIADAQDVGQKEDQTIYLFAGKSVPKCGTQMEELYDEKKDPDGFLYVCYAAENTLGEPGGAL